MSLAALTQPDIAEMVEAAALLSPISYLGHITAPLVWRMVDMHLDQVYYYHLAQLKGNVSEKNLMLYPYFFEQMIIAMGIHQLNFRRFSFLLLLPLLLFSSSSFSIK